MKLITKNAKILIVIVLVLLLGAGTYCALRFSGTLDALKLGKQVQEEQKMTAENKIVLDKLKQIILLPDNVVPNIVSITNIEALKKSEPDFFGNGKNGDALIVYKDLAIIYDVQANKIMKIASVKNDLPKTVPPEGDAIKNQP